VSDILEGTTPGPWEYIPSNENHGAYVSGPFGSDICDCYTMSRPDMPSTANGGPSKPIPFQGEMSDANARLIASSPDLAAFVVAKAASGDRDAIDLLEAIARSALSNKGEE
jgi:hypothetical protein